MSMMSVFACNLTCLILLAARGAPVTQNQHSIIIIVGGTGDLAAKYLWQSVFDVYRNELHSSKQGDRKDMPYQNHTFDFIAAGRSKPDKGNVALNKILTTSLNCGDSEESQYSSCDKQKSDFKDKVDYASIQKEEDFSLLCSELKAKFAVSPSESKKELILFMAIPPAGYEAVLQKFNKQCHGIRDKSINVKLALEKPFGLNKAGAELMSEKVLSYYEEEEIYRVDHYLGKPVVKAILPFRFLNPAIEKMLNKDHVDKVEIFLKETVGVEDRFDVYNTMGVLRDIHQNHLTELLTLVAMDLPSDLSNSVSIHENKERLLGQVESVRRHNSLFGQYAQYAKTLEERELNTTEKLPTFAAVVAKINSPRWRSVPFLLVSGKHLDVRESYVRIVFKNNYVCVSQCENTKLDEENKYPNQVVFHIGHGNLEIPSILVSKSFEEPVCPDNFQPSSETQSSSAPMLYGENLIHFLTCSVVRDTQAYVSVFADILAGRQENFVGTKQLLLSWQVWDYLVNAPKTLRIYDKADPHGRLNFIVKESHLEFLHDENESQEEIDFVVTHSGSKQEFMQIPAKFLGQKLITSQAEHLAYLVAKDIDRAADMEIQNKGSFHVAFAGGTSLIKVFQSLAQSFANLHWHSVHVWQVDERCVPHQDERSNFQMLDRELLRFVDIPYSNIHAMPVHAGGGLCDSELGGSHAYAESLRHLVPNSQLDYIVLGLGTDGHIASLFPSSSDLHVDSNTLAITTEDGPSDTPRRMTLTLPVINKGKRIAIFVTGKRKQEIVKRLESGTRQSVDKYPVLGVKPVNGTVTWYMDFSVYTGV